jgi:4-O-beta-D-mannosyl-D-glucose phosphorylase
MHVATTTIDKLIDYAMNTPEDGLRSASSVQVVYNIIDKNKGLGQLQEASA